MQPADEYAPISPNGFVLVEVLVAMTLIMGCWFSSFDAFQGLVLRFTQQEAKKVQLQKVFDTYELAEQLRANANGASAFSKPSSASKDLKNESSRMSSRSRPLRYIAQPFTKDEFGIACKTNCL